MKFTLSINLGNDAMQTNGDVAVALQSLAESLVGNKRNAYCGEIYDENGNMVGSWQVDETAKEEAGRYNRAEDDE